MSKVRTAAIAAGGVAALVAAATPLVKEFEGRRLDPYFDIANILTVCDGETAGIERRRYSNAECDAMTAKSLTRHANAIQACYRPAETPLQTQVAYLSLAYNIGPKAFCGSTVSRRALAGDLWGSCMAIPAWNKARINGTLRVSRGLENRRAREHAMCIVPLLRPSE